jgi:hypothetical protein
MMPEECREVLPTRGGAIAFGCSPHLVRFEREISLLATLPGCGRTSPIGAKPSRVDSLPNRKSAVAYFDRFTERRKLALPPILIGALCVIIGTAGTSPAMKNWPPRVLLLYDLPDFRMVRLNSRNNPPPYWMSRVRRGTPTTVGKG